MKHQQTWTVSLANQRIGLFQLKSLDDAGHVIGHFTPDDSDILHNHQALALLCEAVTDLAFAVLEQAQQQLAAAGFALQADHGCRLLLGIDFFGLIWVIEDQTMSFRLNTSPQTSQTPDHKSESR